MKTFLYLTLFIFSLLQQPERKIPNATLKTLDGKSVNTSEFSNNGKPVLICFWATWCKCCKTEFDNLSDNYADWKKETGVKIIAISVDDSKTSSKVNPYVKSNGWDIDVYLDVNSDFKRAMNVLNPPHNFLVDNNGNIVWESNSYTDGSEVKVYELIKKLAKGEKIN